MCDMVSSADPTTRPPRSDLGEAFALAAAREIDGLHGRDVLVLDVRGLSQLTNYIVIATGTSDRQIKAVADHVNELARDTFGLQRFGSERDEAATWLVLDFIDVMVHLFEPATRAHYDLEMMWGDAPQLKWSGYGQPRQNVER